MPTKKTGIKKRIPAGKSSGVKITKWEIDSVNLKKGSMKLLVELHGQLDNIKKVLKMFK